MGSLPEAIGAEFGDPKNHKTTFIVSHHRFKPQTYYQIQIKLPKGSISALFVSVRWFVLLHVAIDFDIFSFDTRRFVLPQVEVAPSTFFSSEQFEVLDVNFSASRICRRGYNSILFRYFMLLTGLSPLSPSLHCFFPLKKKPFSSLERDLTKTDFAWIIVAQISGRASNAWKNGCK